MAERAERSASLQDDVIRPTTFENQVPREPDSRAECTALETIAGLLTSSPAAAISETAAALVRVRGGGSGGVAIRERGEGIDRFHWRAAAGALQEHLHRTEPSDSSPFAVAVTRAQPLLMREPARIFPSFAALTVPVHELLLVPYAGATGIELVLWIASHGTERPFDAEDVRFLRTLGTFAAVAAQEELRPKLTEAVTALRTSEAQFRALVTTTSDAVYRMSPDWSEMRQLLGKDFVSEAEKPGQSWFERYIPAEEQERVRAAIQEAVSGRRPFALEHRVRRSDGSTGWVLSRATPLFGEEGQLSEWFGAAIDISARKRAEEELRASQTRLSTALRTAAMCMWSWDPETDRAEASESAADVYGLRSSEDLNSSTFGLSVVHPDDLERHRELILGAGRRGESWHTEFRIIRPRDGEVAWLEERATATVDPRTGKLHFGGLVWDITQRKQAEADRERLTSTLGLALAAGDLGNWEWDPSDDQIVLSKRAAEIYGVEPDVPYSRESLRLLLEPADRIRARDASAEAVANRSDYDIEYRLLNGRWVAARGRGVYGTDGELVRVLGVVHEITARKESEAVLRASERRHRLLAELASLTQPLSDPTMITASAARLLAEHLEVDRCAYAEIEDESVYVITGDYTRGVPSIVGRWEIAAFGEEHLRMMRSGEPYLVDDTDTDSKILPENYPAFRATDIRAVICVPLHKDGRLTAAMAVHQRVPRAWTAAEVELVGTIVARCWEALQRARADRALRESELRFRSLFESMDEGYCLVEPLFDENDQAVDYRYLLVNPALAVHTGLLDIVGKTAREVMPAHESGWIRAYGDVAKNGQPFRRTDFVSDLGRWFEVSAFPVGERRSGQVGVLFTDVTARLQAEEALRTSEQRMSEVFRHAPSFMALLDGPEHVFELANDRYVNLVGRRELLGRSVREAVPEAVRQGFVSLLDRVYRTGEPFSATNARVMIGAENGEPTEERYIDFVYQPLCNAAGAVTGIIVQGVDQTGRKRAEDALRDADRRKDDFIALLAHELRNPLAPLRNGLQVLRLAGADEVRERARTIMERQLTHMVRLIDDLLDISRINRNKMELRKTSIALADVVGHAIETARPAIDEAAHELSIRVPPTPIYLEADLNRLSQVLSNLLTNSAKYTPRGGKISLHAKHRDHQVIISVHDTGIGIPSASLPAIFDMFAQVDRSLERSAGGLGIGLALVKGIVEMHGGTVRAESPGIGQGSVFSVFLPTVSAGKSGQPEPGSGETKQIPRQRILVVDDNTDGAESMAQMLRLCGHDVRTAHDGIEAVSLAEQTRPTLVLMDVGMPRLNGLEATRLIRTEPWGRSMTIIALTGWGQEADRERSRDAGCDGHIVKPIKLSELEDLLRELRVKRGT